MRSTNHNTTVHNLCYVDILIGKCQNHETTRPVFSSFFSYTTEGSIASKSFQLQLLVNKLIKLKLFTAVKF